MVEIEAKFRTFCNNVIIKGGMGETSRGNVKAGPATEPVVYI